MQIPLARWLFGRPRHRGDRALSDIARWA